jgi:uroporphyrinogen-III synthase
MNAVPRVVLFTRPLMPGGPEEQVLAAEGCRALTVEVLRFEAGRDLDRLGGRLREDPAFDMAAVTSRRAAEALAAALKDLPAERRPRCAAVGPASAAPLREAGFEVDVPPPGSGAGAARLASHLLHALHRGSRVLFARGNLSLEILPGSLRARGVEVEELEVYHTVPAGADVAALLEALGRRAVAAAVFASPSAVDGLRALLAPEAWEQLMELPAVAPGDTTAEALLEAGALRVERAGEPGRAGIAGALAGVLSLS